MTCGSYERLMVVSPEPDNLRRAAACLKRLGEAEPLYAATLEEAAGLCRVERVTCVLIQRELAVELRDLLAVFPEKAMWVIPFAKTKDDLDVIDALNSHRCCYYLVEPLGVEPFAAALRSLREYR